MNGFTIREVAEGDHYTYLGVYESVSIDAPLNKERVTKEYKRRVKKVWNSELNGSNKIIAYNTFAVALLLPTTGILDWNKKEIKDLDVATRKIMSMSGSFHKASDVNRLYADRKIGSRGLKNIEDSFEAGTIGLMDYLKGRKGGNTLMDKVIENEQNRIIKLGKEFRKRVPNVKDDKENDAIKNAMKKEQEQKWKEKETHGYFGEQLEEDPYVHNSLTNNWRTQCLNSHIEGFIMATQEQELDFKQTCRR